MSVSTVDMEVAAPEPKHVADVGGLEKQVAGELVVLFVEGAAGGKHFDGRRGHDAQYNAVAAL